MTNLELAVAILAKHREARRWADEAVAVDMLAQFGIDAGGIDADQQHANEPEPAVAVEENHQLASPELDHHEAQDASHG